MSEEYFSNEVRRRFIKITLSIRMGGWLWAMNFRFSFNIVKGTGRLIR